MSISPNAIAIGLHALSAIVWVGGMFFAWMVLRPVAANQLEPPQRLTLWDGVFGRFFPWVWASVILLPASGLWIVYKVYGGMQAMPLSVRIMIVLGTLMILIYLHVFFAPARRLKRAVAAEDWPTGGQALAQIRRLIGLNLILGLVTAAIAAGGRFA